MDNITIKDIVEATGGKLLCGDENTVVKHISIDSRVMQGDDIFVPIIGEKVDAHNFIDQALGNGAIATFTSKHHFMEDSKSWIYVNDTLDALHKLGTLCRSRIHVPAVGVTGSVGKTTTREMVAAALSAKYKVFKTGKNYNSQIGVPITLSEMTNDYDVAVLELGMNVPGELGMIAKMAKLDMAIITNIGVAHMELLGSQDNICKEKFTITEGLKKGGTLFLNGDDPYLIKYSVEYQSDNARENSTKYQSDSDREKAVCYPIANLFETVLYGTTNNCEYYARNISVKSGKNAFEFVHGDICLPVVLSVLGKHNILNAVAALVVADKMGVDLKEAINKLEKFTGFQNRLQVYKINNYTLIDDTYNASPDSMKAGVATLADMDEAGRKIAVLGDMFELGENSSVYHYEVGEYVAAKKIDELITIGQKAEYIRQAVEKNNSRIKLKHFTTNKAVIAYLKGILKEGDVVYLKASNGMKLKEVTESLSTANEDL